MIGRWRWVLLFVATAAVAFFLVREVMLGGRGLPEGLVQANGRIEGDPLFVNAKLGGRIVELPVEEGDLLEPNALVARLDDAAAVERLEQARQRVLALDARVAAAEASHALAEAQVPVEVARAAANVEAADVRRELQRREVLRLAEA